MANKKPLLTPKAFEQEMLKIAQEQGGDEEVAHVQMDNLMAQLLISLGYEKGVEVFHEQGKWYA